MKVYNFLKGKDSQVINDYIDMLDKKGDKEGLRQALKAKKDSESRQKRQPQGDPLIPSMKEWKENRDYYKTLKKNTDARKSEEKGKQFVKSNYDRMVAMKKAKDSNNEAAKDFQDARESINNWKKENESSDGRRRVELPPIDIEGRVPQSERDEEAIQRHKERADAWAAEQMKKRQPQNMDEDAARIEKDFSDEAIQERFKKEDQSNELKSIIEKGLGKKTGTQMGQSKADQEDIVNKNRGGDRGTDEDEAERVFVNQFIKQSRKRVGK
jgi:hypothetical protein